MQYKDKDIRLSKRWKHKPVWSDIHKAFVDPIKNDLADMIGAEQDLRWSESDGKISFFFFFQYRKWRENKNGRATL